ncbi:Putative voltage-gated potassium channel subunit beta [Taphrina deformans PYCC 5710]|uniref:Voltage-gated potassium channel subunit beta n=1 Tax=Taphrina deformans (strain PYCC 5710 / ATCC 11124 / CBS 356.35 / IMI 108563 / JCM 9778 / NBRC 8474) TaxID=1097556 RepID=R4X6Y3_TAPDE|nr:Putative voltage-gated potassium channel subunit beta [Taphrina deformans PYCC 5710]|eukprot:CCG80992.1 Putative voltage-gated potassium channel subunit beta [Taphrina deformans PYCC 5710]
MEKGKRFEPKNMLFRYLGGTGLKVSVMGLGGWLTYGSDGGVSEVKQTAECLQEAWNHGINFFDTAEVYAEGQSEIIMGKALKECGFERDDYVITTKLHFGDSGNQNFPNNHGQSRKHIIEGMNRSLARLQLDSVDVVFIHRSDFWATPAEEVVRAFNTLIDQGKCHYWGTSENSAFEIEHLMHTATRLGLQGPIVEQPQYNMFVRDRFENEYAPLYKLYEYGTTVWSPLYQGILTGKYNDGIPEDSRYGTISKSGADKFETEETKAQIAKVRKLSPIAEKLGGSMASLALAWVIKNPHVSTAILGATKASQITENVKALDLLPKMSDDIMKQIDEILDNKPKVPGAFPPSRAAMTQNQALLNIK